ncbi:MAG: DUF420 domain-containing protein [Saprospiraceae bacterium]
MKTPNSLEKKLNIIGYSVSVAVLLLVSFMRKISIQSSIDFHFLPPFYSLLNAICAVVLIIAYIHIINKRVEQHRKYMTLAMSISSLFLLCYVVYHITTPDTKFCGIGNIRYFYFTLLITHVVLAAVSFPLIVFTYIRGYLMKVEKHRMLAKWVFPIWLFVCISGPVCYLMLRPCY